MIGVLCPDGDLGVAAELFELFKTPWEPYRAGRSYDVVLADGVGDAPTDGALTFVFSADHAAIDSELNVRRGGVRSGIMVCDGIRLPVYGTVAFLNADASPLATLDGRPVAYEFDVRGRRVIRCGYRLLDEVRGLLTDGQPPERAAFPTLDLHIELLRAWIVRAGIPLAEIPPAPWGMPLIAVLTHDIDFFRLKDHRLDHTMFGFLGRATARTLRDAMSGRRPWAAVRQNWAAAAAAPLVYAGMKRDPWSPFESYLEADGDRRGTFFVVPFKGRVGKRVDVSHARRRAVRYDLDRLRPSIARALDAGFEVAVHGIDAWTDQEAGRNELKRITELTGDDEPGVRMHWLLFDRESPERLERAGFSYDATSGYNEAVGYRSGTTQVHRPLNASKLLELPLHVQDTALFYASRMSLSDANAWAACSGIVAAAAERGGALTISWHDRSLAPERLWHGFYCRLLEELDGVGARFMTAREAVSWFAARRSVHLDQDGTGKPVVQLAGNHAARSAGLFVRWHNPGEPPVDLQWRGERQLELPVRQRIAVAG